MLAEQIVSHAVNTNFFWMVVFWVTTSILAIVHLLVFGVTGTNLVKGIRRRWSDINALGSGSSYHHAYDCFGEFMGFLLCNGILGVALFGSGATAGSYTVDYLKAKEAPSMVVVEYAKAAELWYDEDTNRVFLNKEQANSKSYDVKVKTGTKFQIEEDGPEEGGDA